MAPPASLVLFNKLESATLTVVTSDVGGNGTAVGAVDFAASKFNNGVRSTAGGRYVSFSTLKSSQAVHSWLNTDYGCVEFWIKSGFDVVGGNFSGGGNYPTFFCLKDGASYLLPIGMGYLGAGTGVCALVSGTWMSSGAGTAWTAGDLVHIAVSWDKDGAMSGGKTMRIFINGVSVDSDTAAVDFAASAGSELWIGDFVDGARPSLSYVDNFKVWNYAKEDFSDRNIEGYTPNDITNFDAIQGAHNGDIDLSWTDPAAPYTGTAIRRSTSAIATIADGTEIADVAAGTSVYADSGLNENTDYYYKAFPYITIIGVKYYSAGVASTPDHLTPCDLDPPTVTGTTATKSGNNVVVAWVDSVAPDFAGAIVVRKVGSWSANPVDGTILSILGPGIQTWLDVAPATGQHYYYSVFGFDEVPNYSGLNAGMRADIDLVVSTRFPMRMAMAVGMVV